MKTFYSARIKSLTIPPVSFEEFIADEKTIDAVIRNFEIIGEAAHHLPDEIKHSYPSVDWFRLRGFRNRMVQITWALSMQLFGISERTFWHH